MSKEESGNDDATKNVNDKGKTDKKKSKVNPQSRFAARIGAKQSKIGKTVSRMKSRLEEIEDRKSILKPTKPDSSDSEPPGNEESEQTIVVNEDASVAARTNDSVEFENDTTEEVPKETIASPLPEKQEVEINQEQSTQSSKESVEQEEDPPISPVLASEPKKGRAKSSSNSSKESSTVQSSRNELLEPKKTSTPSPAKEPAPLQEDKKAIRSTEKPVSKPKFGGLGGGGIGGRAPKAVEIVPLLHSIIDRLEQSNHLPFVRKFKNHFTHLLKNSHIQMPNILVVDEDQEDAISLSISASRENRLSIEFRTSFPEGVVVERDSNNSSFEGKIKICWSDIASLSPIQIGFLRQHMDFIVLDIPPGKGESAEITVSLQKLAGSGDQIAILTPELNDDIQTAMTSSRQKRGMTVAKDLEFIELEFEDESNLERCLTEIVESEEAEKAFRSFTTMRRIRMLCRTLLWSCQNELERLELQAAISKSAGGILDKDDFEKVMDAKFKNVLSECKTLIESKGLKINKIGQVEVEEISNTADVAASLISDFGMEDLIKEDELDILKFKKEDQKFATRLNRFRFANKLGFIWKLRQEYIENLYEKVSRVVFEQAKKSCMRVEHSLHVNLNGLQRSFSGANEATVKSVVREVEMASQSPNQIVEAIKNQIDINRFRATLFAKKGANAPVEAQQGVLKELKDSRMFVSQLMAFGMLFALLFGSSYAVDVLMNWFSGGGDSVGSDLTQAAKDSRGLGRQIRVLIQAVAGVAIIFYIGLKFHLKHSVHLLERQRIVSAYSLQLEEACTNYIDESSKLVTEVLQINHGHLQRKYDDAKQELFNKPEQSKSILGGLDSGRASLGQSDRLKEIVDLQKWLTTQTVVKESLSVVQNQKLSISELKEKAQ